jgi:hypothetical protein
MIRCGRLRIRNGKGIGVVGTFVKAGGLVQRFGAVACCSPAPIHHLCVSHLPPRPAGHGQPRAYSYFTQGRPADSESRTVKPKSPPRQRDEPSLRPLNPTPTSRCCRLPMSTSLVAPSTGGTTKNRYVTSACKVGGGRQGFR